MDLQIELLFDPRVDDPAGAPRADHVATDLLKRVLGRGQADPLDLMLGGLAEALEREREVGAALGRGDGVDLVDDAPAGVGEQVLGATGEHQVQRLGGRDEDVRCAAQHLAALLLRGVAGAHGDLQIGADPADGGAQVAVDVIGERLQRGDVDEADPPVLDVRGRRLGRELVDPVEERGERLARAGRRRDEHVLAGGDRRPRLLLGGGRAGERTGEPVTGAGTEDLQAHEPRLPPGRPPDAGVTTPHTSASIPREHLDPTLGTMGGLLSPRLPRVAPGGNSPSVRRRTTGGQTAGDRRSDGG